MVGFDLSAAFDTINDRILLDRLHSDFGIDGIALSWLRSYLSNGSQYVKLGDHTSPSAALLAGVPQGSVLGPLLFTTHTSPLSDIVKNFDVSIHQYADDTSLYSVLSNHSVSKQLDNLRKCTDAINDWHLVNFLQLNPQKSEVMFIGTTTHLKNLSPPSSLNIAGNTLPSSCTTPKLIGVTFDSHLSFKQQAISVIKSCNHLIWAIRYTRPFLSVDNFCSCTQSGPLSSTATPSSTVPLPHLSTPFSAPKIIYPSSFFSIPALTALNAWGNCTGYLYTFASSSKSP